MFVCVFVFLADKFNMADPKFEPNDSCPLNASILRLSVCCYHRLDSFVSFSNQTMEIWNQATNISYASNGDWTIFFFILRCCIAFFLFRPIFGAQTNAKNWHDVYLMSKSMKRSRSCSFIVFICVFRFFSISLLCSGSCSLNSCACAFRVFVHWM